MRKSRAFDSPKVWFQSTHWVGIRRVRLANIGQREALSIRPKVTLYLICPGAPYWIGMHAANSSYLGFQHAGQLVCRLFDRLRQGRLKRLRANRLPSFKSCFQHAPLIELAVLACVFIGQVHLYPGDLL